MKNDKKQTVLQTLMNIRGNATASADFIQSLATRINEDAAQPASFLYQFATKVNASIWVSWNLNIKATANVVDIEKTKQSLQNLIEFLTENGISLEDVNSGNALIDVGHIANLMYWLMAVGFHDNTSAFIGFRSFVGVQKIAGTSKGNNPRNLGYRLIKITSQFCKDMSYFLANQGNETVSRRDLDKYWSFVNDIEPNDDFESRMSDSYFAAGNQYRLPSGSDLQKVLVPYPDAYQNLFTSVPLFGFVEHDNLQKINKDLDLLSGTPAGKKTLEEVFFADSDAEMYGKTLTEEGIKKHLTDTEKQFRRIAGSTYLKARKTSEEVDALELADLIRELNDAIDDENNRAIQGGLQSLIEKLSNFEAKKPQVEALLEDFRTDFRKIARFLSNSGDLGQEGKEALRVSAGQEIKMQYLENHRKLFDLAIRMLIGHTLYLLDGKFESDGIMSYDDSRFSFNMNTSSGTVRGSAVMGSIMALANQSKMISNSSTIPGSPVTKKEATEITKLLGAKEAPSYIRGTLFEETVVDPVFEILSTFKDAFLFEGYNAEYTIINPMLFLYEITGAKTFKYENLTMDGILANSREDLFYDASAQKIQLKGSCFAKKLYESYVVIERLSGSIISDWLYVGKAVEPKLPSSSDRTIFELEREAFYLDMTSKIKNIQTLRKKTNEIIEKKSLTDKFKALADLPGMFLGDLKELDNDALFEKYVVDWAKSSKEGLEGKYGQNGVAGKGYLSYFGNYVLPLVASLPTIRNSISNLVVPAVTISNANFDIASKFMSIFKKAGYGPRMINHIEESLKDAPKQVQSYTRTLLGGKKLDYDKIRDAAQQDKKEISYLRQALAYAMLCKSMDYNLVDFPKGDKSVEFLIFKTPPAHTYELTDFDTYLGVPAPEHRTRICTAFELFLSSIYNLEYLEVTGEGSERGPFYESGPYLIASLLEMGFSCKDEFLLQVSNYFTEKKSGSDESKNYVLLSLVEGLARDMDVPVGSPGGRVSVRGSGMDPAYSAYSVSVPGRSQNHNMMADDKYLSFGIADFVKTLAETATAGIAKVLYEKNGNIRFENVRSLASPQTVQDDREVYAGCNSLINGQDFCLHLFRHYYETAKENFVVCDSSLLETLHQCSDHATFGHAQNTFIKKNNLSPSVTVGQFAANTLRMSFISYFVSRLKANYDNPSLGLQNANKTYLTMENPHLGSHQLKSLELTKPEADEKGQKIGDTNIVCDQQIDSYLVSGGNPISMFIGDKECTGSCMKPADAGADSCATAVSGHNNMILNLLRTRITETTSTGKKSVINRTYCIGGGYFVSSVGLEDQAFVAKAIYQATSVQKGPGQSIDMQNFASQVEKGLAYLKNTGKKAYAIIDSLETGVSLDSLLTASPDKDASNVLGGKGFVRSQDWIYAMMSNVSKRYMYALAGNTHRSFLQTANNSFRNVPADSDVTDCYFLNSVPVGRFQSDFLKNNRKIVASFTKNPLKNNDFVPTIVYASNVCPMDKSLLFPVDFKTASPTRNNLARDEYHVTPYLDNNGFSSKVIEVDYEAGERYVEYLFRDSSIITVSGSIHALLEACGISCTKADALNYLGVVEMFSSANYDPLLTAMASGVTLAIPPSNAFSSVASTGKATKTTRARKAKENPAFGDYYDDDDYRYSPTKQNRYNPHSFDLDDFFNKNRFDDDDE